MPQSLNERALQIADRMAQHAADHRIRVHLTQAGARVLDCGIEALGGLEAGIGLASVCLSGLAKVTLTPGEAAGAPCTEVNVRSDHPVLACMASQYAGWQVSAGKFFAMGSGPMRAAYGKEALFDKIPGREQASVAVGVLETKKLPSDEAVGVLCDKLQLPASKLTLLVAPASSLAGTIQVVARSLETALHKLYELKFDLNQVVSGFGTAPLPPVAKSEIEAIGRTNDAILYGGRVMLWVQAEDDQLMEVGSRVPSGASSDHGSPFAEIFKRYQGDFYKIDPLLFSPAQIVFHNLKTGSMFTYGRLEPKVLQQSFSTHG